MMKNDTLLYGHTVEGYKMADPRVINHGYSGYRDRKCRCEICKDAARVVRSRYRKKSDNSKLVLDGNVLVDWLERNDYAGELDARQLARWRTNGIHVYTADRICLSFGIHPTFLYGYSFYAQCFDGDAA